MFRKAQVKVALVGLALGSAALGASSGAIALADGEAQNRGASAAIQSAQNTNVRHRTVEIDGLEIFYREAGPRDAPTIVLLHGFPTSSHMFRDLIPRLANKYRVIAPDYPGYGLSSAPPVSEWEYTFDNVASVVEKLLDRVGAESYTLYLMDYGAPVGFRIATNRPERVEGLVIQNGNAYDEGLREFWEPLKKYWAEPSAANGDALRSLLTREATVWQYTHGTRDPESISPDNWLVDQPLLDRAGNQEIQLAMFLDYGSNPDRYPAWQAYLREYQPATLIAWGRNDHIFPSEGATPYLRDLPDAELHLLDTGHFALEEDGDRIASLIREFMATRVVSADGGSELSAK